MEQAQVEQEEVPVSEAPSSEAPLSVSPVLVQMNEVQDQVPEQVEQVPVVPVVDDFVYSGQLEQIKTIMALESGEQDEHIKTLLVQHKGDIARVVPLLLD